MSRPGRPARGDPDGRRHRAEGEAQRGPSRGSSRTQAPNRRACALASERPDVRVLATDASPAAAAIARENVDALGLTDRVTVAVSDLFSGLAPVRADLIVSNPPYVPTGVIDTLAPT